MAGMPTAQKLLYASAIITAVGVLSKLWLFDAMVRFGIRDQTSLKKRNEAREIYLKIPFALNFKFYFFNVTNPQEIQNGAKPIVKEIGPYWYDEFKERVDVVDNDTEDSLTYTPYDIFRFNQIKSGSLKEDDYVTIIHPAIVGLVNMVLQNSPVFLSIVNKSLAYIFNDPQSIFLTAKVKDILFDGVELNCTSKEFMANAICSQIKTQIPGLKVKEGNENVYLFSLLASKNGTLTKRLKVLRGIFHSKDLGRLVEVDGEKEIHLWNTEKCNRFDGTDGWIFPPLLEPEEGIKSFSTDLCRNIKLRYVEDRVHKQIHVRLYETDLGDQIHNEDDKCYCPTEDTCLKKGVYDLSKCMGVPIFTTLPHFLHTDESYFSQIDGLEPDKDKHGLRVYFEPMTGSPILGLKRLQFNFDLQPTKKVALFSKLPRALFPLLWLEEGADLEGDLLKKIQKIFLMLFIADIVIYLAIVAGLLTLGVALYLRVKNSKEVSITTVSRGKKGDNPVYDHNDLQTITRRSKMSELMGATNHAMSGHEFDRY